MNGSRSRRSLVLWSAVLMLLTFVLAAPTARADTDRDHSTHLAIGSVGVDFGLHQLVINGVNLTRRNGTTSVALAGTLLQVVSAHATQVVAALPFGIEPGDYRLVVWTGSGESHADFWDLTIGAVGPKGDPGAPGLNGKDGAPGLNGKDGAPGLNGKDGVAGLNGQDGAPGLNGKDGAPGPQGPGGVRGFQQFLFVDGGPAFFLATDGVIRRQFFGVPDGVTRILVELWGGSGGGGGGSFITGGGGGGGGYVRAVVSVVPGEILEVWVPSGGFGGLGSTLFTNQANGTGGGATSLRISVRPGVFPVLVRAHGGGFGSNAECPLCAGTPNPGGGGGGQWDEPTDPRITSFLARGGFSGGTGGGAGGPGGRVPSGTVEVPFGNAGGNGGTGLGVSGQNGANGFALISW